MAKIKRPRRIRVLDRDRWICQLCFTPIARRGPYNEHMFPSVDHIIPASRTPRLRWHHHEINLRAAHGRCNSARRDVIDPAREMQALYRNFAIALGVEPFTPSPYKAIPQRAPMDTTLRFATDILRWRVRKIVNNLDKLAWIGDYPITMIQRPNGLLHTLLCVKITVPEDRADTLREQVTAILDL